MSANFAILFQHFNISILWQKHQAIFLHYYYYYLFLSWTSLSICPVNKQAPHHVLQPLLKISQKSFGLIALNFTVLDGLSTQIVIHLHRENGRRPTFILRAVVTCQLREDHL